MWWYNILLMEFDLYASLVDWPEHMQHRHMNEDMFVFGLMLQIVSNWVLLSVLYLLKPLIKVKTKITKLFFSHFDSTKSEDVNRDKND